MNTAIWISTTDLVYLHFDFLTVKANAYTCKEARQITQELATKYQEPIKFTEGHNATTTEIFSPE